MILSGDASVVEEWLVVLPAGDAAFLTLARVDVGGEGERLVVWPFPCAGEAFRLHAMEDGPRARRVIAAACEAVGLAAPQDPALHVTPRLVASVDELAMSGVLGEGTVDDLGALDALLGDAYAEGHGFAIASLPGPGAYTLGWWWKGGLPHAPTAWVGSACPRATRVVLLNTHRLEWAAPAYDDPGPEGQHSCVDTVMLTPLSGQGVSALRCAVGASLTAGRRRNTDVTASRVERVGGGAREPARQCVVS